MADETYYRAEVRERTWLSPHMIRLRLGRPERGLPGLPDLPAPPDLSAFVSTGVADERLVLVLPAPGEPEPPAPQRTGTGWDYPDPGTRPAMRCYTVRAFDHRTAELVVEVVAHGAGVAVEWARTAALGDRVLLSEAVGWYDPPADAEWQLLAADLSGLPALARIVESSPASLPTHAIVEVLEPADRQPLGPTGSLHWLTGTGNGLGPSALPEAVQGFSRPSGPGYVWFAGEAAGSRAVRRHLRRDLGWPVRRYDVLGYWRAGQEEWTRRFERLSGGLERVYVEAVGRGLSSTEALEVYDDALERAGL